MYPYSSYSYYSAPAPSAGWQIIVGLLAALVCTILLYVLVFPKSKEGKLNGFFTFVRNFFGLKYLLIEKIATFIYVLETLVCLFCGFFLLFGRTFLAGLLLMVLGPIVMRLFYELFMLTILLVKNVMEINAKIKGDSKDATSQFDATFPNTAPKAPDVFTTPAAPVPPAAPSPSAAPAAPSPWEVPAQDTVPPAAPEEKVCRNCGNALQDGDRFCPVCGTKAE